jgi:nicotinamidase-related amidase
MKMINKKDFLNKSIETLGEIFDVLEKLPEVQLKDIESKKTALVIVDMINGFAREGVLSSPRVGALIPGITEISHKCDELGILKLAFADCHTQNSPEFASYPVHCIADTAEGEIVDEIKETGGYKLILKNSTNGFHEEEFQNWLRENGQIDTFIITGDCTDICIQQFAITLKTWFNKQDRKARIIVPVNAVETYDLGVHSGDLIHVMALYNMMINGIELVKEMV